MVPAEVRPVGREHVVSTEAIEGAVGRAAVALKRLAVDANGELYDQAMQLHVLSLRLVHGEVLPLGLVHEVIDVVWGAAGALECWGEGSRTPSTSKEREFIEEALRWFEDEHFVSHLLLKLEAFDHIEICMKSRLTGLPGKSRRELESYEWAREFIDPAAEALDEAKAEVIKLVEQLS
jgi:hypothetical protein